MEDKMVKQYEKVYESKTGHINKKDVQEIGEFIEKIKDKRLDTILREIQKHPNHVIYEYVFNNSDKDAVYHYRLERVRWLMREIVYKVTPSDKTPVRSFYNIVNAEGDREYKTTEEVFSTPEFSNQVIENALNELINWRERYRIYKQLSGIIESIDREIKIIKRPKKV
jgi:hypothetical protein